MSVFYLITIFSPINILSVRELRSFHVAPFLSTMLNSYSVFAFLLSIGIYLIVGLGKRS